MITKQSEAVTYLLLLGKLFLINYRSYHFRELRIRAVSDE